MNSEMEWFHRQNEFGWITSRVNQITGFTPFNLLQMIELPARRHSKHPKPDLRRWAEQRWTQTTGWSLTNRFKEWVPKFILVRAQTHQEELETPDGRSGKIRSRLSTKVSEDPSTSRLHFCRLFVLFLLLKKKKSQSQLRSLHPKYSLIRRHCTIPIFSHVVYCYLH